MVAFAAECWQASPYHLLIHNCRTSPILTITTGKHDKISAKETNEWYWCHEAEDYTFRKHEALQQEGTPANEWTAVKKHRKLYEKVVIENLPKEILEKAKIKKREKGSLVQDKTKWRRHAKERSNTRAKIFSSCGKVITNRQRYEILTNHFEQESQSNSDTDTDFDDI